MAPTPVKLKPLHRDELNLAGDTFEVTVEFTFTDNGKVHPDPQDVAIFVPKSVKDRNAKEVGAANDVLVFFASKGVTGDTRQNNVLIHGLRAAGQNAGFVIIGVWSPGDYPRLHSDRPDFCVIRDAHIQDCLQAVGLNKSVGGIRLASHSRGHRGMTRTLLGNDEIRQGSRLEIATIKTPFIDISKLTKLVYLDNFYLSAGRILVSLVGKGLSKALLSVYQVSDGIIPNTSMMQDIRRQFIPLAWPSRQVPAQLTPDHIHIAALGALRFIDGAICVDMATTLNMVFLANVANSPDVRKLLIANPVPPRGTFSTHHPPPNNATDYVTFFQNQVKVDLKQMQTLLSFLNDADLLRAKPSRFENLIAAHHFFVCEMAHELFE